MNKQVYGHKPGCENHGRKTFASNQLRNKGRTLPWLPYKVVRDLVQMMMGALNVGVTRCKSLFVSMMR